jgi:hypothetical protein
MIQIAKPPKKHLVERRLASGNDVKKFTTLQEIINEVLYLKGTGHTVFCIWVGQQLYDEFYKDFLPRIPEGKRVQFLTIENVKLQVSPLCGPWQYSIEAINLGEKK